MSLTNLEIERKFTVKNFDFKNAATEVREIKQGLLASGGQNEIRVTIRGDYAWICVKSNTNAITRFEWFWHIPVDQAEGLLNGPACISRVITKTRYIVPSENNLKWEVDVFHGEDDGLVIAEIELPDENYELKLPSWIGHEVTGDSRYYNHTICIVPWNKQVKYAQDWDNIV